jgi:uncharacterized lipoprotein YddW (UPF0748 family)
MLPGWGQNEKAPASSGQMFTTHPSWFMVDRFGRRMDPIRLRGIPRYAFLDPASTEMREHLASLAGDLARRYAIDGIHLDYIRYPFEHGDYSHTKAAEAAFRARYGARATATASSGRSFKRQQVTAAVGRSPRRRGRRGGD